MWYSYPTLVTWGLFKCFAAFYTNLQTFFHFVLRPSILGYLLCFWLFVSLMIWSDLRPAPNVFTWCKTPELMLWLEAFMEIEVKTGARKDKALSRKLLFEGFKKDLETSFPLQVSTHILRENKHLKPNWHFGHSGSCLQLFVVMPNTTTRKLHVQVILLIIQCKKQKKVHHRTLSHSMFTSHSSNSVVPAAASSPTLFCKDATFP